MPEMYELSMRLLSQLADISIRSLLLAGIALAAILAARTRVAAARHAVWTTVLAAMLALPFLGFLLPPLHMKIATLDGRAPLAVGASGVRPRPSMPGAVLTVSAPAPASAPARWPVPVAAVYLVIAAGFLARFVVGYCFCPRLVRNSRAVCDPRALNLLEDLAGTQSIPWPLPRLRSSNAAAVPMTVGWQEPVILLPGDWESWDEWKLRAVLAHELAHIRRRDWLVALAASLNRSLFWFHPLAWWLERRLATLAEQASDDVAIISTGDAPRYAGVIFDFAAQLRAAGRRLALESVAMARTSNVSRRIDRILALDRPSRGLVTKGAWAAILACALPLVYTAAALQVSQPTSRNDSDPGLAQQLTDGSKISPSEAQELEQNLARDPEDLTARGKLVSYYFANGLKPPAREHIFWLIEHHPESRLATYFGIFSGSDRERAKTLWREQVAAHPDSARILTNAARVLGGEDQFAAEDLLKRARQLEPSNQEWARRLADLFSWSVATSFLPQPLSNLPPSEPGFAAAAKAELETSTDAAVIGLVGEFLTGSPKGYRPPSEAQNKFAELLLQRAQSLDPGNAEWAAALERLHALPANETAPPSVTSANGGQRIRVGAAVQQSNLIHSVDPVYPPLARQARIQGVVRFNVIIGKDGHVNNVALVSGHPLLVPAAKEAVQQWVYKPTLLNGDPVEVSTAIDVPFILPRAN